MTCAERYADLSSAGQAVFEVTHDPARPVPRLFAGLMEISDVGTTFDVYLRPDSATALTLCSRAKSRSIRRRARGQSAPVQAVPHSRCGSYSGQGTAALRHPLMRGLDRVAARQISSRRELLADVASGVQPLCCDAH